MSNLIKREDVHKGQFHPISDGTEIPSGVIYIKNKIKLEELNDRKYLQKNHAGKVTKPEYLR